MTGWLLGIIATLAWGALAFGSNYPWAYFPLMVASAAIGLGGWWSWGRRADTSLALLLSLAFVAVAISLQLVPLDMSSLAFLSPHAIEIIEQRDLSFGLATSRSHSISVESSRTWLGIAFFASFSALMVGTAAALSRESARRLVGSLAILGSAIALLGIVERATFTGKIFGIWELVQGGSPFGPFVNKNHFAGWMLMVLPVTIGYFFSLVSRGAQERKPGLRELILWFSSESASRSSLTAFAIFVMALSLVLTLSRSGIASFGLALMLTGFVMVGRQRLASHKIFGIAYLLLLVVAVVSWVGLGEIITRFDQVELTSANERPAIWADTIRIIRDFWLTGTGLNTYGISTLFYQTAVPGQHLQEAHSDYLQLAAEGGVLLGAPVTLALLAFALEIRRRLRQDVGSIWWIRMGAVTALIAIAVQSTVEFSLQMPGNAALFAVIAGLALHDGRRHDAQHQRD